VAVGVDAAVPAIHVAAIILDVVVYKIIPVFGIDLQL